MAGNNARHVKFSRRPAAGTARLAQRSFLHDLLIAIIPESWAFFAPISASRAHQLLLR
jgi:hypothetical protein